ncbi:hypothetical protein [Nitrosopumilus adriaticus]|uniref:hypothetical protein n=1 Tax=Nitrosopumilus adriaticus TaxID=1580092 RepID=UPI00352BE9B4
MEPHKTRAWFAFFIGLILLIGGILLVYSGDVFKEKFGFLLFGLGGIFWGIMASISLGAQSTLEITKNVIDTLKHEGLISPDSEIRINEKLQVVKPVSAYFTMKHNIEKPERRTPI